MQVKNQKNQFINNTGLIILHDEEWLNGQRHAGKITAGALSLLEKKVRHGTSKTLLELDALAEAFIRDNKCEPTFKNYKGFPNSVCISVNKQLVHGIPTNYRLRSGDLVSFDLGATDIKTGAIGDSALTMMYDNLHRDNHSKLIKATQEALYKSIAAIKIGKRIGVIGEAISGVAKEYGLAVVNNYGGHGVSKNCPHSRPFIPNKDVADNGVRFQKGMSICIEPLFVLGNSAKTKVASDGWTVETLDISSHHEHTIYIHEDSVEIMTLREDEDI